MKKNDRIEKHDSPAELSFALLKAVRDVFLFEGGFL